MNDQAASSERYEVRVTGHLAPRWATAFDGLTLMQHADGTTVLSGVIADQAALHALLRRLGDLGLPIVSVSTVAQTNRTSTTHHPRRSTT